MPRLSESQYRHALHYLGLLKDLESRFMMRGEKVEESLAQFDSDLPQIRKGQAWAAEYAPSNEQAKILCSQYPGVAPNILTHRVPSAELVDWLLAALQAARSLANCQYEAVYLTLLGLAYTDLGSCEKALQCYRASYEVSGRLGNLSDQGVAMGYMALVYSLVSDYDSSMQHYNKALMLVRAAGDRSAEMRVLQNQAILYNLRGEKQKAIEICIRSLAAAKEAKDVCMQRIAAKNLADAYKDTGRLNDALSLYQETLQLDRAIGNVEAVNATLGSISDVYSIMGNQELARDCIAEELRTRQRAGDKRDSLGLLEALANILIREGAYADACDLLHKQLKEARKRCNVRSEGNALIGLGNAYMGLGQAEHTIRHLANAAKVFVNLGDRQGELYAMAGLGQAHQRTGAFDTARRCYERALFLSREMGNTLLEAGLLNDLGNLWRDEGKWQESLSFLLRALSVIGETAWSSVRGDILFNMALSFADGREFDLAIAHAEAALDALTTSGQPDLSCIDEKLEEWKRIVAEDTFEG